MTDVDVPGRNSRSRLQKFLAVTAAVLVLLAVLFGLATPSTGSAATSGCCTGTC